MTTRRQVERAIEAHADALATFPNVVGVGMRSLSVAVYVTEKKPANELDPTGLLPGFVEIDERGSPVKIPVDVVEMGEAGPENRRNDGDDGSTFSPQ